MKAIIISLLIAMGSHSYAHAQSTSKTDPVIEGGKVIVELVKALSIKKDGDKDPGCKGNYADLCIDNNSIQSMTVGFEHRSTGERREVIILPNGKECFLQVKVGVWTYDLHITGIVQSIRKGDVRIEGCNNLIMQIK